ncbi:P-II family nitrogen regulator [bacterium]|nr:P-II family nitrogen regulator [bacterium]
MKEIKALIRPAVVSRVIDALHESVELPGITVSAVTSFGRQPPAGASAATHDDEAMTKIEIAVPDALVAQAVESLAKAAHTGSASDGKIFVFAVEDALRIASGERGEAAL